MKTIYIFIKSIKEQLRDWHFIAFAFAGPIVFMVIFGLAFSSNFNIYKIAIINNDKGFDTPAEEGGAHLNLGDEFGAAVTDTEYSDGTKMFILVPVKSEDEAVDKIESHEITAIIKIPDGFSRAVYNNEAPADGTLMISTVGDAGYPPFGLVSSIINSVFYDYIEEYIVFDYPVKNETVFEGVSSASSEYDYLAPGIMIMAIFFLIIQSAVVLLKEIEQNTLVRLQLSKISSWHLVAGVSATQVLFAIIIVPTMVFVAMALGFNVSGSIPLGVFVGVLTAVAAIAIGLITASVSKNSGEAFLIGNMILVPVVFLSGVFFPLPEIKMFTAFGRDISPFMFQPATHAVSAFNRIFLFKATLNDIWFEIIMLTVLSIIVFAIGVILFQRTHFKNYRR